VVPLLKAGGTLLTLVKPQFELPRRLVPPGGVVLDATLRHQALAGVEAAALGCGFTLAGAIDSPLAGAEGNIEFLLNLQYPGITY